MDIWEASKGAFGPSPEAVFEHWATFKAWAEAECDANDVVDEPEWLRGSQVGAPSPRPRQVFAVGLNYVEHAREAGFALPDSPVVFTKFPSCIVGPNQTLALPEGSVDWEVELVVVIGAHVQRIDEEQAWAVVAGLTVGQDLSERELQHSGPAPQFGLAKSFPGFGATGPVLVTPDELADPDDLQIECSLSNTRVQFARTSGMLFTIPTLIAWISHITPLFPGDLIFTGTPSGIGASMTPPRFLRHGDELVSRVEGIGRLRQKVAGPTFARPGDPRKNVASVR
ncbi:fumarylacetoacetate hydrolase family protein [Amycolatopsis pigmentata]|uniref:Fumarylacetoacetate hydrolase family protein n=1 Tax=Amycolatopsis pigmentata TaxID=450801 RepID=A0ABW5FJI1_9PSEU